MRLFALCGIVLAVLVLTSRPDLAWTDEARAQLAAYRTAEAEQFGCLYGSRFRGWVTVQEIRPASLRRRARSWATEVACDTPSHLLGVIHNHPAGVRCYYTFPATVVPTSDLVAFRARRHMLDAIVCRDHVLWMLRDERPREAVL